MKKGLYVLIILSFLGLNACTRQVTNQEAVNINVGNNSTSGVVNIQPNQELANYWFYFAYGSNMSLERMTERCGTDNFVDLGKAQLAGYSFYFYGQGHANIKPYASKTVEGVLWNINEECLKKLDQVEGYPNVYQRRAVKIKQQDKNILAQVYIVENDNSSSTPSDSYAQTVLSGATEHALSASYIQQIKDLLQ